MNKNDAINEVVKEICKLINEGTIGASGQTDNNQSFEKAKSKAEGVQKYREATDDEYRSYITDLLDGLLDENQDYHASDGTLVFFNPDERGKIIEQVFGMYRGLGLLDTLLMDEEITELMVNGADNIFVEKKAGLSGWNRESVMIKIVLKKNEKKRSHSASKNCS